jgi:hypothetical protein
MDPNDAVDVELWVGHDRFLSLASRTQRNTREYSAARRGDSLWCGAGGFGSSGYGTGGDLASIHASEAARGRDSGAGGMATEYYDLSAAFDARGWWALDRVRTVRGLSPRLRAGRCDALDDDTLGFEVSDTVVGGVAHEDRLLEEGDEGARVFREPSVRGLIPVDGEVVCCIALGTGERGVEPALEGSGGEFAYGVGAGTNGCYAEIHL